jgi:16S rRNA (adenine1518-N6/adenine1519-N6)-dimethyltransferase
VTTARARFGQHFLEKAWADKVVGAIRPEPADVFLEIGPGRGAITWPLAARSKAVIAFEIDRDLAAALRTVAVSGHHGRNVTIVEGDFLDQTAESVQAQLTHVGPEPGNIRVAGNLPYNVASPILFKLVDLYARGVPIRDATVMLQREVADRLVAPPGTREYGVLSILIRHQADVERVLALPAGAFRPVPKVQSAVVSLRFHPPAPQPRDPAGFAALTKAVFTRRRKTLANALLAYTPAASAALKHVGLDGKRRPETLDIGEFVRLSDAITR